MRGRLTFVRVAGFVFGVVGAARGVGDALLVDAGCVPDRLPGGVAVLNFAEIIALLMDLAEQYPQYADVINQAIAFLQGLCG